VEPPRAAVLCGAAFSERRTHPLADPFAVAQVQEFNSYLCSTVHVAHAHRMRGTRVTNVGSDCSHLSRVAKEAKDVLLTDTLEVGRRSRLLQRRGDCGVREGWEYATHGGTVFIVNFRGKPFRVTQLRGAEPLR
jgi:hypothetical protein